MMCAVLRRREMRTARYHSDIDKSGLEMDLMFHFQEHFHFQSGALRLPIGKQELSLEKYKSEAV